MTAVAERMIKAADALAGKSYQLSLVKNYVSHWGLAHAVRELIQNALDSESPFVYEFVPEDDGKVALRLNSEFTTLTPQTLLLGATSKAQAEDAIGSFGEGYKIALLVLTRLGYDVDVLNGDLVWKPRFKFSRAFGDELLVIDERVAGNKLNKGLTFVVHGLEEQDREAIVASCLRMQDDIGQIRSTEYGDILFQRPGKLYVGSLYICETDLQYGYNIKPKHITLERDRQTVSSFDLKHIALQCWYATGDNDRVAKMISENVKDVEYAEYGSPHLVKEACYKIFRAKNPGKLIARSMQEVEEKVKQGMTEYVGGYGGGFYSAVSSSDSYRAERPFVERAAMAPHVALAAFLHAHRGEMRTKAIVAFKAIIKEAEAKWQVKR